jgi:GDP-4-dehydro-6-deoxy-D-mannose reductase
MAMTHAPDRILVTGASGFVGSRLLARLVQEFPAAAIEGLCMSRAGAGDTRQVHFSKADLVHDDLQGLLKDTRPDVIVHLAAQSSVQQAIGAGGATFRNNLVGSMRLIDAVAAAVPGAVFVHASTGEVYGTGFREHPVADEGTAVLPTNAYSRSKSAIEYALQDLLPPETRVIALRPFNHFGPGQDERFVVASFAAQLARIELGLAQPVLQVGNLEARRDFMDVRDMLDAYVAAIGLGLNSKPGFHLYNVASGVDRTIQSVLDDLLAESSVQPEIRQDPARMRASDIPRAAGNPRRFQLATGWSIKTPWKRSIKDVLDYWRQTVAG